MGRSTLGAGMVALGLVVGASSLTAQGVRVGAQASYAEDFDIGIGPRVALELPAIATDVWLVGTFDYFFPDAGPLGNGEDVDYWEMNGNLLYAIQIPSAPNVEPYLGAGVNVARTKVSGSETPSDDFSRTDVGLNILGGLEFPLVGLTPFVEVRLEIDGGEQFVVTGGILFP